MPIYTYTATDQQGSKLSGSVDARSQDIAVGLIKQRGLFVISISEKRDSIIDEFLNFRGIPNAEIVGFTRQFSTMISAGLPLSKALDVLTNQTENKPLKKVLYDVLKSVEGGSSLAAALGRHPEAFSVTYQALVGAGEFSGSLDIILNRLANQMEEERELNAKFTGALIYPAIVLIAMVAVFFILMIFVIPKLADMYANLNVELPFITQVMIAVSNFMVRNVFLMVLIVAGSVIGVRYFLKSEYGKSVLSELMFSLPVFGRISKLKELNQFTSTLSLLLSSAVPIVQSLNITAEVMTSHAFKAAAKEAAFQVEKGFELSEYFKGNPIFPALVSQMASVGQETGKMDEVLEKISHYFKSEVDHLVNGLSAALEPVILIVLGTMVGFLIISIITPIYKITSAI